MKTILISVKPKWAELEMNGKKLIEVRKNYIEPPFKVVNYVTKEKSKYTKEEIYANVNYDWADYYNLKGKVAFEYVVNKVDTIINNGSSFDIKGEDVAYTNRIANQSCLQFPDLRDYLKSKNGYAWHISDLKIYDKPKELEEFYVYNKELEKRFIDGDGFCCYDGKDENGEPLNDCSADNIKRCYECWEEWSGWCKRITRPPQNFVYVREVEE